MISCKNEDISNKLVERSEIKGHFPIRFHAKPSLLSSLLKYIGKIILEVALVTMVIQVNNKTLQKK